MFQKARREQVWTKTLLVGASGSGKSYSALRMATGLAQKCNSRIAVIDTEAGRIKYYANEFDFDYITLTSYEPEAYIKAIEDAVSGGYRVLIIDSVSHEWDFCLELQQTLGGKFQDWKKITPRHDRFWEAILQNPIHVICTARGKDEYVLEERNGKQVPRKVGLGYKQRGDIEYEFTLAFNIAQDTHVASVTKDNTHLFENKYEVLSEKSGVDLYNWANTGEAAVSAPVVHTEPLRDVDDVIEEITNKINTLVQQGIAKKDIAAVIKTAYGSANYKGVTDINDAEVILTAINGIEIP